MFQAKKPNIILISIDTLRPDHLGCYDYKKNTSPNIDRLAKEGVLFTQTFAQSSFTPSSHASIFSSRYVSSFKTDSCGYYFRGSDVVSLPEVLKDNGYTTAAFTGGGWIASFRGFGRGFDIYDDNQEGIKFIIKKALQWLNENYRKRFFLFLHCYDVHQYQSEKNQLSSFPWAANVVNYLWQVNANRISLTKKDLTSLILLYDEAISYVDRYIGRLWDKLEELNLTEDSLIIFLSDHGEAFYEHHLLFHCIKLYDEFIHIPLIMRYPPTLPKSRIINACLQSLDIMPTILEILNIRSPGGIEGLSLMPLIRGPQQKRFADRYIFSESFGEDRYLNFLKGHGRSFDKEVRIIRTQDWKYIYNAESKTEELFNLKDDGSEQYNLIGQKADAQHWLKKRLFDWMQELRPPLSIFGKDFSEADEELIKQKLRSLGYL